jgi:hypothetical protein
MFKLSIFIAFDADEQNICILTVSIVFSRVEKKKKKKSFLFVNV